MTARTIRLGLLLAQIRALRASERGRDAEAAGWEALIELARERLAAVAEAERLTARHRMQYAQTEWAGTQLLDTVPALLGR